MKFIVPHNNQKCNYLSPPARGAWIEIVIQINFALPLKSPPARGAWIEIIHFDSSREYS